MNLNDYMTKHGIKNVEMAKALGFTEGFISKLRKRKAVPNLLNSIVIAIYTNFEVSVVELIDQDAFDRHLEKRGMEPFSLKTIINKVSCCNSSV